MLVNLIQLNNFNQDSEKYKLECPSQFHYLNQSTIYELEGVSNADEYIKTRRAMTIVGISEDEQVKMVSFSCLLILLSFCFDEPFDLQEAIFRALAAILHLGNVDFSPGKEHDSSKIKDETSSFHLQMASDLFM